MGVDKTKRRRLSDQYEFETVKIRYGNIALPRTPTKRGRPCNHSAKSPCRHQTYGEMGRGCGSRGVLSRKWSLRYGGKSPRKSLFSSWKYQQTHRGTTSRGLSPSHSLEYNTKLSLLSPLPSSLPKMAHANPGIEQVPTNNAHNKPLLPLYHHGNSRPHDSSSGEVATQLYVLGIPLHKLSPTYQFLVCVFGVMFFYLLYGYTQEWIFSIKGFKPFGWYLTLVQFAFYALFGTVERQVRMEGRRKVPLKTYGFLAFLTVATMGLSNTSLGYLNYPTQVIFKSCKLIPVMIGGMVIQGKKYTLLDGVALLCMSAGLILFTLADSTVQPNFDQTGVLLISLALCADAVIGNVQEKALKQHSASNVEMVLYSYAVGFFYILTGLILTGSLIPAFLYCLENPHMYLMAAVFSLTGYLGINFVLVLVRSFGALLAVTVTTFRKAVTMVLSFLLFTKPFTTQYVWSGLIVLLGIGLNVYSKNRSKVNNWLHLQLISLTAMYSSRRMRQYNDSVQFQV